MTRHYRIPHQVPAEDVVWEECPGHADDDWVLTSGAGIGEELFCDGTCTGMHAETCHCSECENARALDEDAGH
jgi:hypothetical protein